VADINGRLCTATGMSKCTPPPHPHLLTQLCSDLNFSRGWWNKDPEPRVGGRGVWPKAKKKIVTSLILMAEVVVDAPRGTLDGSPGVQDVFESL